MTEIYQHVAPKIPIQFTGEFAQQQFETVMQGLGVRRDLLNRTFNIRKARAEIAIAEAEAAMHQERLDAHLRGDCSLTDPQYSEIQGRRDYARAQAEYEMEMIGQWTLEIQAFRATVQIHHEEG